jgi:hypothetical protein
MMEDINFKELIQRIVDCYELSPPVARELLQKILAILENTDIRPLQSDPKYEILIAQTEREDIP